MTTTSGLSMEQCDRIKSNIRPTDSDYVRYAKQGGDRDLLVAHEIEKSDVAKPYAKVEWFDHIHNDSEDAKYRQSNHQVENMNSQGSNPNGPSARAEGSKIKEKYTSGGVPYHTEEPAISVKKRGQQASKENQDGFSARQEGNMIKQKYTTGGVPFHTDNMSVWERKKQVPETPMERNRRRANNPIF